MPVAMQLAAKSMNMPMSKFQDMLDDGKVMSEDFILPFSSAIRVMVRESKALETAVKTVRAERTRTMTIGKLQVFEKMFAKATPGMIEFFRAVSEMLLNNGDLFSGLGRIINGFFKGLTFAVDIISPVLRIFGTALEIIGTAFDNAFDTKKASSELNFFTRILRGMSGLLQMIVGGWMMISALIEIQLEDWQEMGWVGKSAILGIAGVLAFLLLRVTFVGRAITWLLGLFKKIPKVGVPGGPPATGGKGGGKGLVSGAKMLGAAGATAYGVHKGSQNGYDAFSFAETALGAGSFFNPIAAALTAANYGTALFNPESKTAIDLLRDLYNKPSSVMDKANSTTIGTINFTLQNPVNGTPADIGKGAGKALQDYLNFTGGR